MEVNTNKCETPPRNVHKVYPLPVFICITRPLRLRTKPPRYHHHHRLPAARNQINWVPKTASIAVPGTGRTTQKPGWRGVCNTLKPHPVTKMVEITRIIRFGFADLLKYRENAHPTRSRRGYTTHRTGNAVLQHNGTTFRERNI